MAKGAHLTRPRKLNAVVVLPPPLTGQTLVSMAACNAFEQGLPFNLFAARNERGLTGFRWTLAKHWKLLAGLLRAGSLARPGGQLYFVPDSGRGLWLNVLEALVMRWLFGKVWLHHHVFSYVQRPDRRMDLILALLGTNSSHIVLSQSMADGLVRNYGSRRYHILGNASFVANDIGVRPRGELLTIGFLGNITREKGIGLFLSVVRQCQASHSSLACLIAGPISDPTLRLEVEAFCAEEPQRRVWRGAVHGAAKVDFLSEIDLLLFPSLYFNEALPLTIYEALCAGMPVLATNRGCIPDQLTGLGWSDPDQDFVERSVKQVELWCSEPAEFTKACRAARRRFDDHFQRDRRALDELVKEMANG